MTVIFKLNDTPYVSFKPFPETEPELQLQKPGEGFFDLSLTTTDARDLLMLLDRPKEARDCHGTWDLDTVMIVLRRLIKLRNIQTPSAKPVEGETVYIDRKLDQLDLVLRCAIEKQRPVVFC